MIQWTLDFLQYLYKPKCPALYLKKLFMGPSTLAAPLLAESLKATMFVSLYLKKIKVFVAVTLSLADGSILHIWGRFFLTEL